MRRGSLFGPIVLLLFGTMFLVHNFRPDIEVWHLFGQYWPLLLIFLGLMKLVQALTPPDPSGPARPLMTGGEVFMIILLCFVGVAVFKGRQIQFGDVPWNDVFGQEYTFSQTANQSVTEAQPNITVSSSGGDVITMSIVPSETPRVRASSNSTGFGTSAGKTVRLILRMLADDTCQNT